jgi:hypothetical protein
MNQLAPVRSFSIKRHEARALLFRNELAKTQITGGDLRCLFLAYLKILG